MNPMRNIIRVSKNLLSSKGNEVPGLIQIAASIMCANQLKLQQELDRLEKAPIDLLHCDVMDGIYVPNLAMGPYVLEQIRNYTKIPLDIHLAIIEPERYIKEFAALKPAYISVHVESTNHIHRAVSMIKEQGVKAAVALNPSTPLSAIEYILKEIDMVLVMTVDPGFAGQKFIPEMYEKIRHLKEICIKKNIDPLIEVDGNINKNTIPLAVEAGANVLVAGTSSIFKGEDVDYAALAQEMLNAAKGIK